MTQQRILLAFKKVSSHLPVICGGCAALHVVGVDGEVLVEGESLDPGPGRRQPSHHHVVYPEQGSLASQLGRQRRHTRTGDHLGRYCVDIM